MTQEAQARRVIGLVQPSMPGPVASLFASSLFMGHSGGFGSTRGSLDEERRSLDGRPAGVHFVLTKTEDSLDSVLPSAPEAFLKNRLQNKFANVSKLEFRYTH